MLVNIAFISDIEYSVVNMKLDKKTESKLLTSLYNYVVSTKDEPLELKPQEFNEDDGLTTVGTPSSKYEKMTKYKNSAQINENKVICDNILIKFFELSDEKFIACLNRIVSWGFDITFKEFILNYYIYIKKSNRLRQYIVMNLDSIISMLKKEIESDLIENMKHFDFRTAKSHEELEFLKNDLRNREAAMLAIKSDSFNEFAPPNEKRKEILNSNERKDLRAEIINRLKYENPKLEEDF